MRGSCIRNIIYDIEVVENKKLLINFDLIRFKIGIQKHSRPVVSSGSEILHPIGFVVEISPVIHNATPKSIILVLVICNIWVFL
ncbi:MAG: hypothetical protein M3P33_01560 [bacterium]|nr:hypothetical protein [bacterium]